MWRSCGWTRHNQRNSIGVMSRRPTSRIALVTGAAGGLGLETFLSVVCTENLNDVGYFRVSLKSNLQ
jgi:hypothetical protein